MNNRIVYLDGIRIISSILVCIAHSVQIFLLPKLGENNVICLIFSHAASYSVVTFFLLSGFMVTNSIFNNKIKNGSFNFNKYWKDRLLRLYPPLIFSLGLSTIVFILFNFFHMLGTISYKLPGDLAIAIPPFPYSFIKTGILQSLFFLQGFLNYPMAVNGPLWSLGDEFFLYIIASFTALIIFNKVKIIPIALIVICFAAVSFSGHIITAAYLYLVWGVGALFSIEKNRLKNAFSKKVNFVFCSLFFLVLFITLAILGFKIPFIDYKFSTSTIIQFSFLLFCIFLFRSISFKWQHKIMIVFEKITPKIDFTYTLYVIHFPILLILFSLFHRWLNSMPCYATILILLCIVPLIIYTANILANYLENKKYIEMVLNFFGKKNKSEKLI